MVDEKPSTAPDNFLPDFADAKKIDADVFNGIARCAELLGIQLIESSFNITPSFFELDRDEGKLALDVIDLHGSFDDETRVSSCIFQFESIKKKGNKKLFSVRDKFVVFYRIPSDCDEFHAISFARRTGVMACYPYFRSHVAQTASLANAEMPILPTLARMPMRNKEQRKGAGE